VDLIFNPKTLCNWQEMIKTLLTRFEQGCKTNAYPLKPVLLPAEYRGLPKIDQQCSKDIVNRCYENCPQDAINQEKLSIDLGKCVFCGTCEKLSDGKFITFTNNFEMGVAKREFLNTDIGIPNLAEHSKKHFKKLFGRSLQLRQVSAGGCNSCEADLNVLNTPVFDLSRFGINFVASPRHADGIVVTGPVSKNMKTALLKTYEALPAPKVVIASGACAISGGPFYGSPEITDWIDHLLPVDLYIPGCPPHPMTALHALLKFFKD
jgi:Ni,Fe-hydrogenase III small subunit/formate hydrogenlyase subunit 6/NADH:ubiquinone oxidoreductase subunit I